MTPNSINPQARTLAEAYCSSVSVGLYAVASIAGGSAAKSCQPCPRSLTMGCVEVFCAAPGSRKHCKHSLCAPQGSPAIGARRLPPMSADGQTVWPAVRSREIVELAERSCTSEIWSLIVDAPDHHGYQRVAIPLPDMSCMGLSKSIAYWTAHFTFFLGPFLLFDRAAGFLRCMPRPPRAAAVKDGASTGLTSSDAPHQAAKPRCSGPFLTADRSHGQASDNRAEYMRNKTRGAPRDTWRPPCNGHTSCDRTFLTMRCPAVAARHGDAD